MAPEGRRVPPWGTFAITLVLLLIVAGLTQKGQNPGLAGAIVGGVVSYWLPTSRHTGRGMDDG